MRHLVFVVLGMLMCTSLFGEVPNEITYQGRLREYGQPISGTRNMNFRIYRSVNGPGMVWETGDIQVAVSSGVFSSVLNPIIDWREKDYWVEVSVAGKILTPREKLTAQAYSLHSKTTESITTSAGDDVTFVIGNDEKAVLRSNGEFVTNSNGTMYYMVPKGVVVMWAGRIDAIPDGWALCDGRNGTPDLRDRFVMSVAGSSENPGAVGGVSSYSLTISQLPSHNHVANSSLQNQNHTHTGTTNQDGVHTHNVVNGVQVGEDWSSGRNGTVKYMTATDDGVHSHKFTTGTNSVGHSHAISVENTGGGAAIDNRPAYYKIAFIIKL